MDDVMYTKYVLMNVWILSMYGCMDNKYVWMNG
jgi:hypothetical protein